MLHKPSVRSEPWPKASAILLCSRAACKGSNLLSAGMAQMMIVCKWGKNCQRHLSIWYNAEKTSVETITIKVSLLLPMPEEAFEPLSGWIIAGRWLLSSCYFFPPFPFCIDPCQSRNHGSGQASRLTCIKTEKCSSSIYGAGQARQAPAESPTWLVVKLVPKAETFCGVRRLAKASVPCELAPELTNSQKPSGSFCATTTASPGSISHCLTSPADPLARGRSNPGGVLFISPVWAGQETISLKCIEEGLTLALSLNILTIKHS